MLLFIISPKQNSLFMKNSVGFCLSLFSDQISIQILYQNTITDHQTIAVKAKTVKSKQ